VLIVNAGIIANVEAKKFNLNKRANLNKNKAIIQNVNVWIVNAGIIANVVVKINKNKAIILTVNVLIVNVGIIVSVAMKDSQVQRTKILKLMNKNDESIIIL